MAEKRVTAQRRKGIAALDARTKIHVVSGNLIKSFGPSEEELRRLWDIHGERLMETEDCGGALLMWGQPKGKDSDRAAG
mgnify:CR=1 FL=1